jgi:hypothetical protein
LFDGENISFDPSLVVYINSNNTSPDRVVEDVARLGCRKWKVVTLNREGWRKLLKEAEARPGL